MNLISKSISLMGVALFASSLAFGDLISSKKEYVPNEETAIRIAEAVWLPIYGENIYKYKPFEAHLDENNVWHVYGSLPETFAGGTPEIKINKVDGRILGVWHGQ